MGVVYRAVDRSLGRTVAIKLLAPGAIHDEEARRRFLGEAQAAALLDHPNVGTIHELGEWEGQPFIVMSYYDGLTLAARIRGGPLPVADVMATLAQIAAGLEAAHGAGVVHRDLKPANVMVTASGQIKILDFGLALLLSSSDRASTRPSSPGTVVGTIDYMSPEQARGDEVDHRTDLWAAGVIAYEMLAGVRPFRGDDGIATLARILTAEPRPIAEVRPDTPPALAELASRLLRKRREDRPGDARSIAAALATSLGPLAIAIPPAGSGSGGGEPASGRSRRTEVRAILLTDVVDSTKLSGELGDAAMTELWARHDRLARDLLVAHGGREIDKTDGFLLLFSRAADAAEYALAYHRALRELGLSARAGLHVGPVVLRENPLSDVARGAKPLEVDGLAKPTAARVMATACGGQTLLTPEAREALGPTALRTLSHGHWRMKGVPAPVELFEVGDEDAPFTPPPDGEKVYRVVRDDELWLPARQIKHNLPRERDAFVGREPALKELARLLEGGAALVSVLGPGGSGKTRLVVRYGWSWLGDWPGGVWFCDLSEARDADGLVQAVARTLDVPLGRGDAVEQLGHVIAARGTSLVILDNFEQVAAHASRTLGRWLDRAPMARFVVTTRVLLGLRGDAALALDPFPLPDALALFVARAAGKPLDALGSAERADLEALVGLLDGLPLAVELVAARARVMPCRTLLSRMSERFKLLATPGVEKTRQSTLRATLDWSWNLLGDDERAALAQLSVFEGGFGIEAAEAVLSLRDVWALDAVQGLVDKSLVRRVSEDRYDLQMSVREYAAERLAGAEREEAERRHGRHHAALGSREAMESFEGPERGTRMRQLVIDIDNLVVAIRRAVARQDGDVAAGCLSAAWGVLEMRGPVSVAADLAAAVTEMPVLPPRARTAARKVLGQALQRLGRPGEALRHMDAALSGAREQGLRSDEAAILHLRGELHLAERRLDLARADLEEGLPLARAIGDRRLEGRFRGAIGSLHGIMNEPDAALPNYEASLAVHRERGSRRGEAIVRVNLGVIHSNKGRLDEARIHYESAIAGFRAVGDRRSEAVCLQNLGVLLEEQGRLGDARLLMEASLALHREVGDRRLEGDMLGNLGNHYFMEGRLDQARAACEESILVARETKDRRSEGYTRSVLGAIALRQGAMDEARTELEAAIPVLREVSDRRNEARALALLGRVRLREGAAAEGRALLQQAASLLRDLGAVELAEHHAIRAEIALSEGDADAASAALAEAQQAAPDGHAEVAGEIARVRRLLQVGPGSPPPCR